VPPRGASPWTEREASAAAPDPADVHSRARLRHVPHESKHAGCVSIMALSRTHCTPCMRLRTGRNLLSNFSHGSLTDALHPMHATADRKKFAVEFLESEGHAAEESLAPVLEIKIAHFCGETIDEIQQLLRDLGEFLTVEAVDQKGDLSSALWPHPESPSP